MQFELALREDDDGSEDIGVRVEARPLATLGLTAGAFASLAVDGKERVVRVAAFAPRSDADVVYLPAFLAAWFDRRLLLDPLITPTRPRRRGTLKAIKRGTPKSIRAESVELQRLGVPARPYDVTPQRVTLDVVGRLNTRALRHFFSEARRYLETGDVFTVTLPGVKPYEDAHGGKRYYKVTEVMPQTTDCARFINTESTRASLKDVLGTGFLPVQQKMETSQMEWRKGPLFPYWKELAQIVAPALAAERRVSYRLGVLLHGSAGKMVAVEAAAKALGMKLSLWDCLDMQFASLESVCQQLAELKEEAKKYVPCFIVLRHVQFLSTWFQEATSGIHSQSDALLSSALHELTQQSGQGPEE